MNPEQPIQSFQRFSSRFYLKPEVKHWLLQHQQSSGLDANMVLLACWLGRYGQVVERPVWCRLQQELAQFRQQCLLPLRELRLGALQLKPDWLAAQTKRQLLTTEIELEWLQQQRMLELLPWTAGTFEPVAGSSVARATANLCNLFEAIKLNSIDYNILLKEFAEFDVIDSASKD